MPVPSLLPALLPALLGAAAGLPRLADVTVETVCAELDGGTGGVSVDAEGRVYVADFGSRLGGGGTGGDRVFRVSPDGAVEVFAEGFRGASGSTFDAAGAFYQSSIGGGYVERLTPGGERSIVARAAGPVGVVVDDEGVLFVASCGANRILEVLPDGTTSVLAASPLLACPNGLTIDENHDLYVANFGNGDVLRVTPLGDVERVATLPGNNNGHLIYHAGELLVVARGDHRIYRVSLDGEMAVLAGSGERGHADGPALEASFSFPNDLELSPDGRTLYVNESVPLDQAGQVLAPMRLRAVRLGPREG